MITPIGVARTGLDDPDNVAHQSNANRSATGTIKVSDEFADALLGLDRYDYLWLLTWLDGGVIATRAVPLTLVPRAKEARGEVQGLFASRSPTRPNSIGLSLVRNLGIDGTVISFAGVDLLDGTRVLDIKPWFSDADLPPSHS